MSTIALKNVTKSFRDHQIISGIDLELSGNACTVLVGPSGCGKSTLLRLICGLEEPTTGEVHIDGRCVNTLPPVERGIAMVFQSYALYPHMTVFDNMAFALKISGCSKTDIAQRVHKAAKTLNVEHLLDRKPKELSGGQRQRVAIGRAIVRHPKIFLFDEPLSNLDAALRVKMRHELARLKAELKTTMIYVTHDQSEAMTLADTIVVMRDGRIEQAGTPLSLYHHPENLFVAGFIGSPTMNFLKAIVEKIQSQYLVLRFDSGETLSIPITRAELSARKPSLSLGETITVGIRPEDIKEEVSSTEDGAIFSGKVSLVENLGNETHVWVTLPGGATLNLRQAKKDVPHALGQEVALLVRAARCHIFDPQGKAIQRTQKEAACSP
ncbi:MAG: ABC transporter ATP-binding protein [Holosporales bacterium]|jgi:multiple sugar transport system ATP-binding protein|nr:ABC transporter ATP-binding protein [Holosporales bacterium]